MVGVHDPDIFRQVLHSEMTPPNGNNRGRYRNRRVDRLTERGAGEMNRDRRRRIYARVQRIAARELPYVSMWWPEHVLVSTNRLQGFTPHPAGDLFELYRSRLAGPPRLAGRSRAAATR